MISLTRASYQTQGRYNEWAGLSTDDKDSIAQSLYNKDEFYEIDTGKTYCYDAENSTWVEKPSGGGGGLTA